MDVRLLLLAALSAVLLSAAAPAQASLLAGPCPDETLGQPFLPWLDVMNYVAVPDGGLERGGAGWTLSGASVVNGNERFNVGGAGDSRSLSLPSGSSAVTPATCGGLDHPTLRFFARRTAGSQPATLRVEALHDGGVTPVGLVTASGDWQPTLPLPIAANLLPHLGSERAAVAFRFTAAGGTFRVDDVFVDPYGRY